MAEAESISDEEVGGLLRAHLQEIAKMQPEWRSFRAAYETDYWEHQRRWQGVLEDDELPIKMQINGLFGFVSAHVANLFYRAPRVQARVPTVFDPKAGRPPKLEGLNDTVASFLDEWIRQSTIRKISTYAYQLALMYEHAAYKLRFEPSAGGSIIDRVVASVIPRWECVWDTNAAQPDQMAYIGHLRWELLGRARKIVEDDLEGVEPEVLPDYLTEKEHASQQTPSQGAAPGERYKGYVRLLEFYDLVAGEQRFYIVTGSDAGANARPVGEVGAIPYAYPNGRPAVPIVPVILANIPEKPLQGISAVKRVYGLASEKNLLYTIAANQMRRDAGRVLGTRGLDDDNKAKLMSGKDMVVLDFDDTEGSLEGKIVAYHMPSTSGSLDKWLNWLRMGEQDVQSTSELQQGRSQPYISATQSQLLAAYGEATSSDLQQRMQDAMRDAMRFVLVVAEAHVGKAGTNVVVGREVRRLKPDELGLPWNLSIADSASTPRSDQIKKTEFVQILPQLLELAKLISDPDPTTENLDPELQQQLGAAETPEALRKMAKEMLKYMVQLWQLPERFDPDMLLMSSSKEEEAREEKKEARELFSRLRQPLAEAVARGEDVRNPVDMPALGGQGGQEQPEGGV